MKYRPKDWENPYIAKIKEVSNGPIQPMALFSWKEMAIEAKKHYEAGADAMLDAITLALFEKRLKVKRGKGYLELIPEGDDDDKS